MAESRMPKTRFWGANLDDDRLVRQILRGEKTATCCPSRYFGAAEGDYRDGGYAVGDLVAVYDLRERLRCIIEITAIYETVLGDPPEELWRGEGNDSADEFVREHFACWKDLDVSAETRVTATHFILREVIRET